MQVAMVEITSHPGLAGQAIFHRVGFSSLSEAWDAYNFVKGLMTRREERKNDLPKMVELVGVNSLTIPLDVINAVGISDYEKENTNIGESKVAFPHLYPR